MSKNTDSKHEYISLLLYCSEKIKELIDNYFVNIANVKWQTPTPISTEISNYVPQHKIMSDYQASAIMLNMWAHKIKTDFLEKNKAILKNFPIHPEQINFNQWLTQTITNHFHWELTERQLTLARMMRDLFREQLTNNPMSDWMKNQNRHFSSSNGNEFDVSIYSVPKLQNDIMANVPEDKLIDPDFFKITNEKYQAEISRFLDEHTSICHYFGITEITLSREFLIAYNPIEIIEEYDRTTKAALEAKQNQFNEELIFALTVEPSNVFRLVFQTVSSSRFFSKNLPETRCAKVEMAPVTTDKKNTLY